MHNIIMLVLLVIVIATSVGIYFWFSKRLGNIEEELWGDKRKEAEETALKAGSVPSENDTTES